MAKKTLLVADDDEMNRMVISRFLGRQFDILEAKDGEETISILREKQVDALILDILMPRLDGLDVLKIIKEENINESIGILVATSTKEMTEREALALGADDIVSKPYDPVVIQKRLDNIIMLKEKEKELALIKMGQMNELLNKQKEDIKFSITDSLKEIKKLTEIIDGNLDNEKMLQEMVKGVNKQIENMSETLSKMK